LVRTAFLIAALALPAALPFGASAQGEPRGAVAGVVRFTGTVPAPAKFLTADGNVLLHSDLVVDPKSRGLRDVVLVLEGAAPQPKVDKASKVLIDQRDMLFVPRVVAVRHGQVVRFENNDTCNHAVMAQSPLAANQFNTLTPQGQPYEHAFAPQKHPVQIGCPIHPWMRAWVYVVPHPWFAVTDSAGRFRIEGVPPGRHTIWLRHPDTGKQERRVVTVAGGRTAELNVDWKDTRP
jgi:plastocyanin